jgi:hypothetical protein
LATAGTSGRVVWSARIEWQRQGAVGGAGAEDGQAVLQKVPAVFLAGADHAFPRGKRGGAPVAAIDATVVASGDDTTDVSFARVVVGGNVGVFQKHEQLETMPHQPFVDPPARFVGVPVSPA